MANELQQQERSALQLQAPLPVAEGINGAVATSNDGINLTHPLLTVTIADGAGVAAFCNRFGLSTYLSRALEGIARYFSTTRPIRVSVTQDPEFPDEWLELDVTADGEPGEVSAAHDRFTRELVTNTPPHVVSRVRLMLDLE